MAHTVHVTENSILPLRDIIVELPGYAGAEYSIKVESLTCVHYGEFVIFWSFVYQSVVMKNEALNFKLWTKQREY